MPSYISSVTAKIRTYVDNAIAAIVSGAPEEDTEANIRAETGSKLVRNTDTGEWFAIIDGDAYLVDVRPLPTDYAPMVGGSATQQRGSRVSGDGGVLSIFRDNVYLRDIDGNIKQITVAAVDQGERFDVESAYDPDNLLGLGADQQYSTFSGNSDAGGENPIAQNFQCATVGGSSIPVIIGAKGDDLPENVRLWNHAKARIRDYLGDISLFMAWAVEGEEGQNTLASTAILDADGDELDTNLEQGKRFFVVASSRRTLDGTDHLFNVTSADNGGKIRFTVAGKDLTSGLSVGDHISIYASDGVSCNGNHRITGISFSTDTTIDVNTDHQTGDATKGKLRALARLEKYTSTAV